jgi:hypothetical protein
MRHCGCGCAFFLAAALLVQTAAHAIGLRARDVWFDPQTGFAIGGYDPVDYFVRNAPNLGRVGIELELDGVAWRFSSEANRAVFAAHPEVYTPRFGARDPVQLARGYEAKGNPAFWLIEDGALYLFADVRSRARWMTASESERLSAAANWPAAVEATR